MTGMSAFINLRWTMSIILFSMVLGGTFYCGWACLFGTLQELMNNKYTCYIILLLINLLTSNIIFSIMLGELRNSMITLLTGKLPALLSALSVVAFLFSSQ